MSERKLIVGVMDGAFAFWRKKEFRDREYMCDVAEKVLRKALADIDVEMKFHAEKGGMWNGPDRRIRDHLLHPNHNTPENVALLIGKSGGGWDISKKILRNAFDDMIYNQICVIVVDATYPFRCGRKLQMPNCNVVINIYQTDPWFIHGGPVKPHPMCTDYIEKDVTAKNVDHFNIIHHTAVERAICGAAKHMVAI